MQLSSSCTLPMRESSCPSAADNSAVPPKAAGRSGQPCGAAQAMHSARCSSEVHLSSNSRRCCSLHCVIAARQVTQMQTCTAHADGIVSRARCH